MKRMVKLAAVVAAAALALTGCSGNGAGSPGGGAGTDYPKRDIGVTVPFNAGGSTDLTARTVGEAMGTSLKTKVMVTNTPGAGGSVGTQTVMNAKNDGYSILADGMLAFTSMPVMGTLTTMPKDWDFWLATFTPNVIAVQKDSPYQTLDDLIQAMKDKPGQVSIGTAGPGSAGHIAAELFTGAAGTKYRHAPYNGGNPAIVATLSKEVDATTQLLVEMQDMLVAGDLRGLATFAAEDIKLDNGIVIPTMSKALPSTASILPMGETTGFAVQKGLDEQILAKLDAGFAEAMKDQKVLDFCKTKGMTPVTIGRSESQAYVAKLQSVVAWTLQDAGVAAKSPDEFQIPRP
ncbi:tripartite tricarboxylate transporter substrate binding protein [Propioniciclava coleopterorum]|uniref:Tripartite tricarboxylate transporter substrate binding protein n=1 Tax=Propioniciclava coleopterorum TaxID=2714937 RepID=A0A6G7Y9E2_9ACTN|nr:tripartite tricarboxylate transporter substrate binding protein [Propioniciclava coleopterorum]QIK73413.1 tripartite tricarboxylate transporter substrate binding protein [Propioniciclava coleopterorum]